MFGFTTIFYGKRRLLAPASHRLFVFSLGCYRDSPFLWKINQVSKDLGNYLSNNGIYIHVKEINGYQ